MHDSEDPTGPTSTFTPPAWTRLLTSTALKETGPSRLHQHRPSLTDRSTVSAYPPGRPARAVTAGTRSLSWSGRRSEHFPGNVSPRSR
ncbi:DUF397 domain-containing protein [Micromonospora sp. CA-248260]|uniref:DUF397 domain-containing protein n=1 Tax=Micromonospora sp. CA-248260 TaxID=3239962 RepID=UPI003D8A37F8